MSDGPHRMRDLETAFTDVQYEIQTRLDKLAQLNELAKAGLSADKEEDVRRRLQNESHEAKARALKDLRELLSFPPMHIRHQPQLPVFWEEGGYDESVFIMTKFPVPSGAARRKARDEELETVLAAVQQAVCAAGFKPRIATTTYHPQLWDNVELHLVGCRQGIAVVEDRYLPELNPNVVMEWGWMRAAAKPVLFLVEENFKNSRADLKGLLQETFSWSDPSPGISAGVSKFLREQAKFAKV